MKKIVLLCSILMILLFTGCTKEEQTTESIENIPKITQEPIEKQSEELKEYRFASADEVEQMSDEDLIYIAKNDYSSTDFFEEGEYTNIDYFGVELMREDSCYEDVRIVFFHTRDLECELDLVQSIPAEEYERLIDKNIEIIYSYADTMEPGSVTGSIAINKETIFCGENDYYSEYRLRYVDRYTMYENNVLTTTEIPIAEREIFMKNIVMETNIDRIICYMLGELSVDCVKEQLDIFISSRYPKIVFREVIEEEDAYIYSFYFVDMIHGDYGINDTAMLRHATRIVEKETHVLTWEDYEEEIREVEIYGTAP